MSEQFDPYHAWLEIPPKEQPPNHYRLLGLEPFESDTDAIEAAADQRAKDLRAHQEGEHSDLTVKLLSEVSVAKVCLLNPDRKASYDSGLREQLEMETLQTQQIERKRIERFLEILEEKDLLSAKVIRNLRKQLAKTEKEVKASSVARRLVRAGHLTSSIAKRLLAKASEETTPEEGPAFAGRKPATPPADEAPPPEAAGDSSMGLAPLDDEPAKERPKKKAKPKPAAKPKAEVEPEPPTTPEPTEAPPVQPPPAPPAESGSLFDEELQPAPEPPAAATGPLDGMMDDGMDAMAGGSALDAAPTKRKGLKGLFKGPKKVGKKENVWDSSLLLVGGGALLALVILGAVLVLVLRGESGDQALAQADEEYHSSNYAQAVHKYDQFLEKFPGHEGQSIARVNRGLCQLWQKSGRGTRDWSTALQTAKEVLEKIRPEKEFKEAHGDLAAILLAISEGLAEQAQAKTDPQLVAQCEEALDMLELNVRKSLRPLDKMSQIRASLALTVRDVNRGKALANAIADMAKAVKAGDTRGAYAVRKRLLNDYPRLADDEQLKKAVFDVSRAQREAVEFVEESKTPEAAAEKSKPAVLLAQPTVTGKAPVGAGHVVLASAGGAAYGLDAATGKVLWRKFLGFDSNGKGIGFPPKALLPRAGEDVLLVDPIRDEVLRVKAADGKVVWRYAVGERFDAPPVLAGDKILVATREGRLVTINTADGNSSGYVRLPQALHVAPAADSRRSLIFQLADHSNLFLLTLDGRQCKLVYYLGHEVGSITAPPVVVSRYLVIVVNNRAQTSALRVFRIDEGEGAEENHGGASLKFMQEHRLTGHVDVAPIVDGRSVLVTTDRGAVTLFEISATDEKKPLNRIADLAAMGPENVIRFPLMHGGLCWIADEQLAKYEIQRSLGQMAPKGTQDEKCVFQQPLRAIDQTIFHVRTDPATPGSLVAAVSMTDRKRFWETRLATPLAGPPRVDMAAGKVTAVTATGGLFSLEATDLRPGSVVGQPLAAVEPNRLKGPLRNVVWLAGGMTALTGGEGGQQIVVHDPRRQDKPFRYITLGAPLACRPIVFSGGLLAPLQVGQVFLMDPATGGKVAEPFQPALQPGAQFDWRTPAVSASHGAVLADGSTRLYRLAVASGDGADQPANLVAEGRAELSQGIVSPVAVVGDLAFAVDAAGVLSAAKLPELTRVTEAELMLGGPLVWGPRRVGGQVVMLTTDKQLLCVDGTGKLRWQVDLPYGPLAGAPLEAGGNFVLASTTGTVWRLDGNTGDEIAKVDIGQPLATGPVGLGRQFLLGGHDGSLHRVKLLNP